MFKNIINLIIANPAISISILSLTLSLYNFVYNLISRKCKIKVVLHKHFIYGKAHQLYMTIQNCSQLPVSISNICINKTYFCVLEPVVVRKVTHRTGNTVTSVTETKTIPFPINLNSLESCSGYLEFRNTDNIDEYDFSLSIFTNRKAIKKVKILTSDDLTKKL